MAVVFTLLTVPLLRCGAGRMRTCLRCCPALGIVLLLLPSLLGFGSRLRSSELTVTLLSVGAGQCAVVRLPSGKTVLFDAGSSTITDVSRTVLRPYFKHEQIRSIDGVFVSHANFDHYSAVSEIVGSMDVPRVHVTPHFRGHAGTSATARALIELLGTRSSELSGGQRVALDESTSLEVLWPPKDRTLRANDSSLVLRLNHAGRSILFTGDIQSEGLRALLLDPGSLKSDVLIAPHHGSIEAETERFVAAVDPLVVLSSNDGTLSQKQREFDRMMKDRPLFRTHESGAIHVRVTPVGAIEVGAFVGDRAVRWDAPPVR
jgi:competence protein ComEC